MSTPGLNRSEKLGKRHLIKGAASAPNLGVYVIVGVVLIAAGVLCKGQGWSTPAMFAGLGLDLAMTITNIGIILAFIGVLNSYFYVPLKEAIDERDSSLDKTFTEAEALKAQMTELRNSYEARLAKTEAEAREQIQAQIKEAQVLRKTLMEEATERADALVKKAELEIEAEKAKAIAEIRNHVVDLSLAATEKLLAKNVDSADNRKLVAEFIDSAVVAGV